MGEPDDGLPGRLAGPLRRLLTFESRSLDRLFTLLLTAFIGLLLAETTGYKESAQIVPYVIGVPTFVMLVVLVARQTSTRFDRFAASLVVSDIFRMDEQGLDESAELGLSTGEERDPIWIRYRVLLILAWILVFIGLTYLIGFLYGIFVFLLVFYRFQARLSLVRTVAYAVVIWAFIWLLFIYLLSVQLFGGILV